MLAGSVSKLKPPSTHYTPHATTANKPLYAWEMTSDMDEDTTLGGGTLLYPSILRDRIYTVEYGSFVPSSQRGIYLKEKTDDDLDNISDSLSDRHNPRLNTTIPSQFTRQYSSSTTHHLPSSPTSSLPSHHLDIQIILTPSEFEAFLLRKSLLLKKGTPSNTMAAKHAAKYRDISKCKESKFLRTQTPYIDPKRILKELYRPSQKEKWIDNKGFQLTNMKGIDEDI